jgi:Holliday junction resolvasome RuvABC endonuclease subunit
MSEHVWAIDPGLSRVAFAFADVDSDAVEVETLTTRTTEREGARLGLLDRRLRIYARQAAGRYPPACVWIEQPSGRFTNLQLTYAVGVIQAALFETLACPVWTIPSGAWKLRSVGAGNATKEQVRAWVDRLGVEVENQDEADAVGIAVAGRAMLLSGSWAASAAELSSLRRAS